MGYILVTGGAGFIGANLCRRLLQDYQHVICVDNLISGLKENIEDLKYNKRFYFEETSICDKFSFHDVDVIYNLACPASPIFYKKYPFETLEACFIGVRNLLSLAKKNKAVMLHASTSEVYGNPLVHPQSETYYGNVNFVGERSCYDEGKRIAETLCALYRKNEGVDVRVARIFNTYGPYMRKDDGRVISSFVVNALRHKTVSITGDGKQTRSFCYIDDTLDAFEKILGIREYIGPVNVGNPSERTINSIIDLLEQILLRRIDKEYVVSSIDDPIRRKPDISLMKEQYDWTPNVSFETGLEKTVNYFCEKLYLER